MTLALFDLDNTLLAGDSDHAWGEFLVDEGLVDGDEYRRANDRFYQEYLNGELDIYHYQRFVLAPLTRHDMPELQRWRERFIDTRVRPMLQERARALVEKHRRQGHTLVIITATNRFVTEPIAALLGIEHLIATEPEIVDGRFTGDVAGVPSFQEGKVTRLQQWLEQHGHNLDGAWFYSDSHNDLPLLQAVSNPVAVDPDPVLEQHAREAGWPVMSLRD